MNETIDGDWSLTCRACGKQPACELVRDAETGAGIWVCASCREELWNTTAQQGRIVCEIDTQITHHREEGNEPAIASLEYIRTLILKS